MGTRPYIIILFVSLNLMILYFYTTIYLKYNIKFKKFLFIFIEIN